MTSDAAAPCVRDTSFSFPEYIPALPRLCDPLKSGVFLVTYNVLLYFFSSLVILVVSLFINVCIKHKGYFS